MIKAIIFDFGNTIYTFDNDLFLEKIADYTEKPKEELYQLIYKPAELPRQYELGQLNTDEFIDEVSKLCSLKISNERFIKAFTNIFEPIPETVSLIKKLSHNYRLGLLSNTNELDFNQFIKSREFMRYIESVTLSYEVQAMKPNTKIFADALSKLKLKAKECIYVDDVKEFVDSVIDFGINGIYYRSHKKLLRDLERLGITTE